MRVGITASRNGMTAHCVGGDREAHDMVRRLFPHAIIHGHPPLSSILRAHCVVDVPHEPRPYLKRNQNISDAVDVLFAAPAGAPRLRSGTWSTVRYSLRNGREVRVIRPDGALEYWKPPAMKAA